MLQYPKISHLGNKQALITGYWFFFFKMHWGFMSPSLLVLLDSVASVSYSNDYRFWDDCVQDSGMTVDRSEFSNECRLIFFISLGITCSA